MQRADVGGPDDVLRGWLSGWGSPKLANTGGADMGYRVVTQVEYRAKRFTRLKARRS